VTFVIAILFRLLLLYFYIQLNETLNEGEMESRSEGARLSNM
jgi:hypothetical protein